MFGSPTDSVAVHMHDRRSIQMGDLRPEFSLLVGVLAVGPPAIRHLSILWIGDVSNFWTTPLR